MLFLLETKNRTNSLVGTFLLFQHNIALTRIQRLCAAHWSDGGAGYGSPLDEIHKNRYVSEHARQGALVREEASAYRLRDGD
jgi:hypothetical protein